MLWDTHCHLYQEYYENLDQVLNDATAVGVTSFIVDGCDQKSNEEVLNLGSSRSNIFCCLGIHPENVDTYQQSHLSFIEEHLREKQVIGIGEIGLDYHYSKENKEQQKELFEAQLQLASKYHFPVVIHSREATEDTIALLKKYPDVKGVIHSFTLSIEVARIYIQMGYKLGINGVVTFKNSHLKEILHEILPYILLETDSPYLTPHPYRGTRNEPKYIQEIATFICEHEHISLETLIDITNQNIKEVFGIEH